MRTPGPAAALATAGVVVAVDQATKQLAVSRIERGEQVNVFFGLDVTNARNTGVAFGALEGGGVVVAVLIGLSLTLLLGYFALNREKPWLWLPVGLLLGGALGNLTDRVFRSPGPGRGAVVDFIDFRVWPVFNIADSAIVVGGLLAVLLSFRGIELDGTRKADPA